MDATFASFLGRTLALALINFVTKYSFYIILIFMTSLTVCYHWKRRYLYIMAAKIHGPISWPLVGNALWFLGDTADILQNIMKICNIYNPPCTVWIGTKLFVAVSNPEDMDVVMNSPHALEKDDVYRFIKPLTGLGLFSADVRRWKRNRKIIMQTFNPKILNSFVPIYEEQAKILVTKLDQFVGTGNFDVFPLLVRCTVDIVCETAMGVKVNSQSEDSQFVEYLKRTMELSYIRIFQAWLHPDIIYNMTSLSKEMAKKTKVIYQFAHKIIRQKRKEYRERKGSEIIERNTVHPLKRKAFLDHLIQVSEEESNLTDEDISYEVITMLIGGNDSTASMSSFAFVMLGMHPEIQDRVYRELEDIFDEDERPVTHEDFGKMKYLERVIKETMRLFPVGPILARAVTEDIRLNTCTIPKGASCALVIIHTHRDPKIWPDPLKFDPDRFLPEEVSKRHPYSYVPFSGGPRNCVGGKYAMMSMKTVISTVLRSYRVSTDYKKVSDIRVKADIMIQAADGCRVAFEHRNK